MNTQSESPTSPQPHLLLVEDDLSLAEWIVNYLRDQDYAVVHLAHGSEVVERVRQMSPDLIVLDVMLPFVNGFDLCRELRSFYTNPILMLTACTEEMDEVLGLELGANDYLSKPVRPRVLLARIKALLRRDMAPSGQLRFGQLSILQAAKTVFYRDQMIPVTAHEFDVLWLLASQAGQVVSRESLVTQLRGIEYDTLDRSIDLRISRLRKKLNDSPEQPYRIKTVRARGYLFSPDAWN